MNWSRHCKRVAAGKSGFPVVEIVWKDASAFGIEWEEKASNELRLTTTCGYLVDETEEAYVVASLINTDHVGHGIVVSKSSVVGTIRTCLCSS